MIRSLRERLLAPRAPAGYRPGATLACLARNLGQQDLATAGVIQDPAQGWQAKVHERVEAHLLMHIVTCEFQLQLAAPQGGEVSLGCAIPVRCAVPAWPACTARATGRASPNCASGYCSRQHW
ncbi:hypothetical protein GLGCALEP_04179 [Pseudomonas sp. MM221]|nr:hypothetical protein GLGCALEP_04179 [Pseudomonas sp. MM221]